MLHARLMSKKGLEGKSKTDMSLTNGKQAIWLKFVSVNCICYRALLAAAIVPWHCLRIFPSHRMKVEGRYVFHGWLHV